MCGRHQLVGIARRRKSVRTIRVLCLRPPPRAATATTSYLFLSLNKRSSALNNSPLLALSNTCSIAVVMCTICPKSDPIRSKSSSSPPITPTKESARAPCPIFTRAEPAVHQWSLSAAARSSATTTAHRRRTPGRDSSHRPAAPSTRRATHR